MTKTRARIVAQAMCRRREERHYHLRLGDAYYKLLRHADAGRAYTRAKELGVREADDPGIRAHDRDWPVAWLDYAPS